MFPSFEFLGRTIGMYAVFAVIGLLACGFVSFILGRKLNISFDSILMIMLSIGGGILIGGHILYGITHIQHIIGFLGEITKFSFSEIIDHFAFYFGGAVFYGGFIGAIIAICIHTKFSKKIERNVALDLYAVCAPLFLAFGRIGCFFGGCCYGVECSWGFTVYDNEIVPDINGVQRLPVQLIEAAFNFLVFFVMLYLFKNISRNGKLIYTYIFMYAPFRFVIEFFRGDAIRGFVLGLSTSQWISIILVVFAVVKLILLKRKEKKNKKD